MQIRYIIAVFGVLFWSKEAKAEGEYEVKRGAYSFMAFVYYSDETIVDYSGARFVRSAVLIKPQWLLSGSIDHPMVDNVPTGFPRKTLLARAGAISVDANFGLNEDEDEQEQEVIQIVRPAIHNVDVWWFTDITVLKTLLPFNMTSAVSVTNINPKKEYAEKSCLILFYAKKYANSTEDKILMQLAVELLPAKIENCGNQFSPTTMTCAQDGDDAKNAIYDPNFCQGNSGGPLICESEVMGLQTYIQNNCKAPHLYQQLSSWDSLINCSVQEKCSMDYCSNICSVTPKDDPADGPVSAYQPAITSMPSSSLVEPTETTIETTTSPPTTEVIIEETEMTITMSPSETETASEESSVLPSSTVAETPTTTESTTSTTTEQATAVWPKEKQKEDLRKSFDDETSTPARKAEVEAQQLTIPMKPMKRSAAEKNAYFFQSLLFLLVLVCVV